MNDEMVAAVHQYSNRGWVVHPLAPPTDPGNSPGKRPLLPGWQKLTKTPENIETYIKEGCNLGLVCGKASGVTVFDLDSEIFVDDLFEGVKINKTLRSRRTSGRGHIYFKYNPNLKSQKHHALEIEILSDGSNAVLPPSVHRSGERYVWNDESAPLLEIPAKLTENWTHLCDQEKRLNSLISKCRPCFKSYWKNEKKVFHGPNARLFLGAFCSELSNKGADLDLIKLFAKIIYRNDYDENKTITEFNGWTQKGYKPWTCEKLKEQCVGFTECDNCPIKTRNGEKEVSLTKLDGAISTFKQPDMLELAERMQRSFPIYFDRARIYWMWVHERRCYTMVDETDILSVIRRALEIPHLAGSSVKNEILEAIRVTGRERDVKLTEQTWVHLANGVYDLKTKTLFEATPEHLFTTPIPHKMSKSTDKLTTIDRLFAEWVGPDKKTLLYEICAYCLYDGYPIHRLFCCVGKGRNGKGQFLTLLGDLPE